jgi:hypothetical protein
VCVRSPNVMNKLKFVAASRCIVFSIFLVSLLHVFTVQAVQAQTAWRYANPRPYWGALEMRIEKLSTYPPISILTRPEVLAGYLYLNDYVRNRSVAQVDSFFVGITYSDTLRAFAKYLYIIDDEDPLRFSQWLTTDPSPGYYKCTPAHMRFALESAIERTFPDTLTTSFLVTSDIIARVKIIRTTDVFDSAAARTKRAVRVDAIITDVIKGKHVPTCLNIFSTTKSRTSTQPVGTVGVDTAITGKCLQFEYRLDWSRIKTHGSDVWSNDSLMVSPSGKEWVQKDSEYVVFLRFSDLGEDSTYNYRGLRSNWGYTRSGGIFPIRDGKIYDPQNQMRFGTNAPATLWINAIRSKIYSITNP